MSVHETVDIVMAVMVVVVFVLVCISPRTHACLAHTTVVIVKVCIIYTCTPREYGTYA